VSPWRRAEIPEFSLDGELLRFFDTYLMDLDTGLSGEPRVRYFCMHAEVWREAAQWPPVETTRRLFLDEGGALSTSPGAGEDRFTCNFGFGTGTHTRYGRLAAHDIRTYYDDWQPREATLPCYHSEPLDTAVELVGHAVLGLHLAVSEPDAALHVYLSEEEPDGTVRYVTEGGITHAAPEAVALPAELSGKLAVPQLRSRRRRSAHHWSGGRDRSGIFAHRLALRQG
jgi:putative CocE/NonD family hydrolase